MNLDQLQKIAEAATPARSMWISPDLVLRLIAVARAAKELTRLMDLPMRLPEGPHPLARVRRAEYGEEKLAAWAALRSAIEELDAQ